MLKSKFLSVVSVVLLWSAAYVLAQIPASNLAGTIGIHDPSAVIKCNGTYYVVGSNGGALQSKDRKNWTSWKSPVATQTWWKDYIDNPGIWAADITYMDGTYYCYYSVSASMDFNSCIGVCASPTLDATDPACKWTDLGCVIDSVRGRINSTRNINVIDPSTILDSDGKWYLSYGSFCGGCKLVQLNRKTGKLLVDPPSPISITNQLGEGSFAAHWKNYYFYTVSRGKCCSGTSSNYQIVYGRSVANISGPYYNIGGTDFGVYATAVNTVLLGKGGVYAGGAGGQSMFWDNDTLFMNFHAYTAAGTNLEIHPLYATSAGWLTLEPSKGTVITGKPPLSTAISNQNELLTNKHLTAGKGLSVRVMGLGASSRVGGHLYTITGEQYSGKNVRTIPMGIYIEKR